MAPITDPLEWSLVFEHLAEAAVVTSLVPDVDDKVRDLVIEHINAAARRFSPGLGANVGKRVSEVWPLLMERGVFDAVVRTAETGRAERGDAPWSEGERLHITGFAWVTHRLDAGRVLITFSETSERVWRIERERARFRAAFESSVAGMALLDLRGAVTEANERLGEMIGLDPTLLVGCTLRDLAGPVSSAALVEGFHQCLVTHDVVSFETRIVTPLAAQVWAQVNLAAVDDPAGNASAVLLHVLDVSHAKRHEHQLAYAATHDALTGLPNRLLAIDHLELALARVRSGQARLAVAFLDLDHFKVVNDSLGHGSGDGLLREVAVRLGNAVRPGDTIARLGGDEFVLLLELGPDDPERALAAVCERLLDTLREPVRIEGHEVVVQASIGVVVASPDASAESLLRDADIAMYETKRRARGGWTLFTGDLHARALSRLQAEVQLRAALSTNEIRSYFQPVVDLATRRTVGFEALARWNRDGTVVGPSGFLDMAEETGLIVPLTERVAWDAARGLATWRRQHPDHPEPLWLSFNVSARQLAAPGFAAWSRRLLDEAGLDPRSIVLEVTERTLLHADSAAARTLDRLRDEGYRVAIDDFGTGYSSLAYLRSLPVDIVKIDRVFVVRAPTDPRDRALLQSFVHLAEALSLDVIAEGIETEEQAELVTAAGCRWGQGYQLARPTPQLEPG